ncbi:MAG: nucleotidyltransferase family protein [Syntrophomonadaceae bacterium]|nr:nucleotidyltransferase family protein [Syntrophomonadaceae bacterium]
MSTKTRELLQEIQQKREQIINISESHGAYNVRVFGSVTRGDENEQSDIDFLMDFVPGSSLIDLISVKQSLEELLNRKVDVVTEKALHPGIRDTALKEAIPL